MSGRAPAPPEPGVDDQDLLPISVRLGQVVPPEDPEDWTRPLTWAAAVGMLLAPALAVGWYVLAPPGSATRIQPGTLLLAAALAVGAVLTGATQQGRLRATTATLAAGLFAALATIAVGAAAAGERQVGAASPSLAHAVGAALAGLSGAAAATPVVAILAAAAFRWSRVVAPAVVAAGVAVTVAWLLFGGGTTPV